MLLTIIGIPLLVLVPFLILGLLLGWLVGFTAVGYHVGRLIGARLGWTSGPYAMAIAGILAMFAPLVLARIVGLSGGVAFPMVVVLGFFGTIVAYLAWTIGFGAVALARFASSPSSA